MLANVLQLLLLLLISRRSFLQLGRQIRELAVLVAVAGLSVLEPLLLLLIGCRSFLQLGRQIRELGACVHLVHAGDHLSFCRRPFSPSVFALLPFRATESSILRFASDSMHEL